MHNATFSIFQSSQASWPSGQLLAFYKDYISGRSYEPYYNINTTDKQDMEMKIRQHFVGVQMYMDPTTLLEHRDVIQMTFIGYVCHLGSALNLWSGITVVVLIELVELFYEIIVAKRDQARNEKASEKVLEEFKVKQIDVTPKCSEDNIKEAIRLWLIQMLYIVSPSSN